MDVSKLSPAQLQEYPAMQPPVGHISHFGNPIADGYTGNVAIIVSCVLAGLALVTVSLRIYARLFVAKLLGWEDYCCVAAMVGTLVWTGIICHAFNHGVGIHQWNLTLQRQIKVLPILAFGYIYLLAMLSAKLAICFLFNRLFSPKKVVRYLIYVAIALCFLDYVVGLLVVIFICIPKVPQSLVCEDKRSVAYIYIGGLNMILDVVLLALPLFTVAQLKMKMRRKVAVCSVFLVGLLACVSSAIGLHYRIRAVRTQDESWNTSPKLIACAFELNSCIIISCMPILPSLRQLDSFLGISVESVRGVHSRVLRTRRARKSDQLTEDTIEVKRYRTIEEVESQVAGFEQRKPYAESVVDPSGRRVGETVDMEAVALRC